MSVVTLAAARKNKQVEKILNLLKINKRSFIDTIMSFAYLIGQPLGRERKGNKNKISKSNSPSISSSIIDSDQNILILFSLYLIQAFLTLVILFLVILAHFHMNFLLFTIYFSIPGHSIQPVDPIG